MQRGRRLDSTVHVAVRGSIDDRRRNDTAQAGFGIEQELP